jgi:hypothetical protein
MVTQIVEEFRQSLCVLDEKIQNGKYRLQNARRENHEIAVRLSAEQSETKRLHDNLCNLQSRLYHQRFSKDIPDSERDSSLEQEQASPPPWAQSDSVGLAKQRTTGHSQLRLGPLASYLDAQVPALPSPSFRWLQQMVQQVACLPDSLMLARTGLVVVAQLAEIPRHWRWKSG